MSRGHDRERAVKADWESRGWLVIRAAGSLGNVDLVALKANERPVLIEVKSTAGGPFERFGPKARTELLEAAKIAGATPLLVWWPPRAKPQHIHADAWPTPGRRLRRSR